MDRVPFTVGKGVLLPKGNEAALALAKLTIGETVGVEVYRERDTKFSNWTQVVFNLIAEGLHTRVRNVRGWLATATGRADMVTICGRVMAVPHSTGPRDMRAEDYEAFWEDAEPIILNEILPTLKPSVASEIRHMIEDRWRKQSGGLTLPPVTAPARATNR